MFCSNKSCSVISFGYFKLLLTASQVLVKYFLEKHILSVFPITIVCILVALPMVLFIIILLRCWATLKISTCLFIIQNSECSIQIGTREIAWLLQSMIFKHEDMSSHSQGIQNNLEVYSFSLWEEREEDVWDLLCVWLPI